MDLNSMIQPEDEDEVVPYNFQDGEWGEVIEKYKEHKFFHKITIKGRGTALHVAISNGYEDHAKSLVDAIERHDDKYSGLRMLTERGDTPLHLAAYRRFKSMCEYIIGKNGERGDLIRVKNAKGETPLFLAVLARHKKLFLYLHRFFPTDVNIAMNHDYATILHVAIRREKFDMANIIMRLNPVFAYMKDKDGVLPLEDLATCTSAFKSGTKLSWVKKILYNCVSVKSRDAKTIIESYFEGLMSDNVEDEEKANQGVLLYNFDELEKAGKIRHTPARLCFTVKILCYHIQIFVFTIWHTMFSSPRKRWRTQSLWGELKSIKKKHIYGGMLLEAFMKEPYESSYRRGRGGADPFDDGEHDEERKNRDACFESIRRQQDEMNLPEREGNKIMKDSAKNTDTKDTTYLIAAKHGITEIMRALEYKVKNVVHDTNYNNENALLLAVKNRQVHVVEGLLKHLDPEFFYSLSLEVDNNENTILHLVACKTSYNEITASRIYGVGMQMMWDIKWYEYIERLVPEHFQYRRNKEGKTPGEIFMKERKELLKESIEWLKKTSESCSVLAALVAGVSFATIGSVPGGNQQTGYPIFEAQPAFHVFSMCSIIGLYFSVNSLVFFLSILTCRKHAKDFSRSLPLRLLVVLGSLYVSIVAMFISFCGGHYFLLTDKYNKNGILFYFYLAASFPVTWYALMQFPYYADLLQVVLDKVPPPKN